MSRALTDASIRQLAREHAGQRCNVSDPGCHGLKLRLGAAGRKTWALYYWVAGRQRTYTIGTYPEPWGLADAREEARRLQQHHRPQQPVGHLPVEARPKKESRGRVLTIQRHGAILKGMESMGRATGEVTAPASTSQEGTMDTLSAKIGIDGKVKAEFVAGDWTIRPDRYIADREEWRAAGRSLRAILPDGATLRDGTDTVTVRRDARGIPELVADGKVWMRLSSSNAVVDLLRHFGHAVVSC